MAGGTPFPEHGTPRAQMMAALVEERDHDLDWRGGKAFSLVYHPDDP